MGRPPRQMCTRCNEHRQGGDPNYAGLCALCAWREWGKGQGWDKVECIECELGRDHDRHPVCVCGHEPWDHDGADGRYVGACLVHSAGCTCPKYQPQRGSDPLTSGISTPASHKEREE